MRPETRFRARHRAFSCSSSGPELCKRRSKWLLVAGGSGEGRLYCAHLLCNFQQRRIKLHEGVVDGAVVRMARIASFGSRQRHDLRLHVAAEIEVGPFAWKAR